MNKVIIGEVITVVDEYDGERIRVRIRPDDNNKLDSQLPYAFPLMPKMFHVKPKIGESVFVICAGDNSATQRYYIGPIISQPQQMYKSNYAEGSTNLLNGSIYTPYPSQKEKTKGSFLKDDEIGILGRKNSQIVLSDNDIRIRCGASTLNPLTKEIGFNKVSPAFLKLKYYESPQMAGNNKFDSTATIVADEINLISNNGNPYFKTSDTDESISDDIMKNIIEKAHLLPYGDILCEMLASFFTVFKNHVHNYGPQPPIKDDTYNMFVNKYGDNADTMKEVILSKHIRIN